MEMSNDALRALRAPIEDRIDLRHRILDAVVDRGGQLKAPKVLAAMVDRIDGLVWVDGDMRKTRLRYEIFNTCMRKHINLADQTEGSDGSKDQEADLLESLTEMLMSRGTGQGDDFGGHPDFVDPPDESRADGHTTRFLTELIAQQQETNLTLCAILEKLANPPVIISGAPVGSANFPLTPPLTEGAGAATDKKGQPSGNPGAKGKAKS